MSDSLTLFVIEFFILQFLIMVPLLVFMKLGGWPEGFYRIFRIKYFVYRYFDEDWDIVRIPIPWRKLITHSPTYFDYHGKRRYIDELNTLRSKGRPSWIYSRNNAFPLPAKTLKQQSVDAEAVRKAFNSKQLQDYLKTREGKDIGKSFPTRWLLIGGLIIIFVIFLVSTGLV